MGFHSNASVDVDVFVSRDIDKRGTPRGFSAISRSMLSSPAIDVKTVPVAVLRHLPVHRYTSVPGSIACTPTFVGVGVVCVCVCALSASISYNLARRVGQAYRHTTIIKGQIPDGVPLLCLVW